MIRPTTTLERIPSLDFLRGLAILGILFINIENFAYPDPWSPWKYGFENPIDHSTRFWVYFLTQGKFYTMFALLFGVGFYLFLERLEKKQIGLKAMDIYARRLLWLFVIGILHAYFIWDGDVLYHYTICGFLLFPFRSFKSRNILLVVGILASLLLIKSCEQTQNRIEWRYTYSKAIEYPEHERTKDEKKAIRIWKKITVKSEELPPVNIKKETYFKGLQETYKHASAHKGMLYYQGLLFPSLIVMLIGIVLYRTGIFQDYRVWRFYWPITIIIMLIGIGINYYRYFHWTYQYFEPVTLIPKGWLFTFPKEILGIGYVLLFNGIYQALLSSNRFTFISNIGRLALSNYIFQNLLLGLLFYGYGFALFNQFSRTELLLFVFGIWVIQITLSALWLRYFQQGPLEILWKRLTYRAFRNDE